MLIVDNVLEVCPKDSENTVIDLLPETVKRIDSRAFCNCKNLEVFDLPSELWNWHANFDDCCNLKEITIPDKCSDISLTGCRSLKKIEVPATVKHLRITGCHSLAEIVLASDVHFRIQDGFLISKENILIDIFNKKVDAIIPQGVVEISSGALSDCPSLVSVFIPASVKTIRKDAFYNSPNLKEIKVASGNDHFIIKDGMLLSHSGDVLYFCPSKEGEIVVPDTVDHALDGAFSTCKSKNTRIVFSHKFITSDSKPFKGMENCTICLADFQNWIYASSFVGAKDLMVEIYHCEGGKSNKFFNFGNVKGVKIPMSIENLDNDAFRYCTELTELQLPESLKKIGERAFCGCKSLDTLVLPDAVESVGEYAFVDVKQVEMSNVCSVEKSYLDLDAPILFEGTNGRMYCSESTNKVIIRGIDCDESRQRFELHRYWFGEVKHALQALGCTFFYWDMVENTFAVRVGDYDIVFNGSTLLPIDKVVGLVSVFYDTVQNEPFKMKITESLNKAKAKPAPKKAKKPSLFKTADTQDDVDSGKMSEAKKGKIAFMYEQIVLAQVSDYTSENEDVMIQLCSATKSNVVIGVNYKHRYCFTTSISTKKVEDGTVAEEITNMLRKLDENDIDFKVI